MRIMVCREGGRHRLCDPICKGFFLMLSFMFSSVFNFFFFFFNPIAWEIP